MANLKISAGITNADLGSMKREEYRLDVTTTGDAFDYRKIDVGTSEATFTIDSSVGDCGYLFLKNADDTNFVQVGFATTVYVIRLKAGQPAVLPIEPGTSAIYLKADTATCEVEVYVHEA